MMILGQRFARIFDTSQGQLLVYAENLNPESAVLHQMMQFSDVVTDKPVAGTPEQVLSSLQSYDILEAEHEATEMARAYERDIPNIDFTPVPDRPDEQQAEHA